MQKLHVFCVSNDAPSPTREHERRRGERHNEDLVRYTPTAGLHGKEHDESSIASAYLPP